MLKLYCSSCGSPTNYTLNKPKFCSHCGNSFDKSFGNVNVNQLPLQKITKIQNTNLDYDVDDELDVKSFNKNLEKLNFDIHVEKNKSNKIKDIAGTYKKGENSYNKKQPRKKMSKLEKKKILDDIKREASSIKPKNKNG